MSAQGLLESLAQKVTGNPDFWSVVDAIELEAYEALAAGRLKDVLPGLLTRLDDTRRRVPSVTGWQSVETTARFTLGGWLDGRHGQDAGERQAVEVLLARLASFVGAQGQG